MPHQCRFDSPDDVLEDDEQNMYAYAMQIWVIQRELHYPLWEAGIFSDFSRGVASTIEFLPEYRRLNIREKEMFEE
jgi:hypothetical protein